METLRLKTDLVRHADQSEPSDVMIRQAKPYARLPRLQQIGSGKIIAGVALCAMFMAGISSLVGSPQILTASLAAMALVGLAIGFFLDLSERQSIEQINLSADAQEADYEALADRMWELQESEERFLGLIDALGDLVIHRDREGRIVYANNALAQLLDTDITLIKGMTLPELGIGLEQKPDPDFAETSHLTSADVAIHTDQGTRWFSWIEHSMRDNQTGQVSHRAIARDITARKNAEAELIDARMRAEAASQAKSRFLATVSHEIRTPMNGVIGMAKLLADTGLTPEQKTYVDSVSNSADALMLLIEDLLDFSKIEAGRIEIEPQQASVREIIDGVVELLAARAFAKEIAIAAHVEPNVPETITTDPGKLRQVLLNLAGNAVKFTEAGGVSISVSLTSGALGPMLHIDICDTGPGLAPADQERIFGDFEQADGTTTRKHGGAGLGLAISKRIITAMGGVITVDSDVGKGATFSIEIPNSARSIPNKHRLAGRHYLLLLANRVEADTLATTLRSEGAQVTLCQSPQAAMHLSEISFDAVLVGAGMEHGQLLDSLRAAGLSINNPVILIAPRDRGRLLTFQELGYANFLARPVRGRTLLRILTEDQSGADLLPSPEATSSKKEDENSTCLNILLAEDNPVNAMLARAALTRAGHTVEVASDGGTAVEMVTARNGGNYDIILMDLHMPVMDGLDALLRIRAYEETIGRRPAPVLVLTADNQEETRSRAMAHGANGFLTKPLDPDRLVSTVMEAVA